MADVQMALDAAHERITAAKAACAAVGHDSHVDGEKAATELVEALSSGCVVSAVAAAAAGDDAAMAEHAGKAADIIMEHTDDAVQAKQMLKTALNTAQTVQQSAAVSNKVMLGMLSLGRKSADTLIRHATVETLKSFKPVADVTHDYADAVLMQIQNEIKMENSHRISAVNGNEKPLLLKMPDSLPHYCIAELLAWSGEFANISMRGHDTEDGYCLAMRCRYGEKAGLYQIIPDINKACESIEFVSRCRELSANIKSKDIREAAIALRTLLPKREVNDDTDLVYMANGVYDYHRKKAGMSKYFTEYDDPDYWADYGDVVRLTKWATDYNANAHDVAFTMHDGKIWTVEKHFASVMEKTPVGIASVQLLWMIGQSLLRKASYHKMWYFANAAESTEGGNMSGGNGKSGILDFWRYALGSKNVCGVSVMDIANDSNWSRSALMDKQAILSTESNNGNTVLKNAGIYKQLIRSEPFEMRAPYSGRPIEYHHKGVIVQAINSDKLLIADESDSPWRNVHVLRFEKTFATSGCDARPYIVDEYIKDKAAREYLVKRALDDTPYLDNRGYPQKLLNIVACNVKEMANNSNAVSEFMSETIPLLSIEHVSYKLLWGLFLVWRDENSIFHQHEFKNFQTGVRSWAKNNNYEVGRARYGAAVHDNYIAGVYIRSRNSARSVLQEWVHPRNSAFDPNNPSNYEVYIHGNQQYQGLMLKKEAVAAVAADTTSEDW